jgi:transcriptional regulator with XRE-family HTH domain
MADSQPAAKKPGSKLAQLRKAKGWSQQDLAVRARIHAITVSEVERGATDPKQSTLEALAAALDVTVADLLNGDPKVAAS